MIIIACKMHLTAISAFIRPKVDILNNCHQLAKNTYNGGRGRVGWPVMAMSNALPLPLQLQLPLPLHCVLACNRRGMASGRRQSPANDPWSLRAKDQKFIKTSARWPSQQRGSRGRGGGGGRSVLGKSIGITIYIVIDILQNLRGLREGRVYTYENFK